MIAYNLIIHSFEPYTYVPIVSSLLCYCKCLTKLLVSFFIPCRSSCPQASNSKAAWDPDEVSSQQTMLAAGAQQARRKRTACSPRRHPEIHRQEASELRFCTWLQEKHYPFHRHPQRAWNCKALEEHSKWDAFALGVLSWSQSQWQHWLGSPSNLSWTSSAKDSDMKLGWAHSIPNGTLVWVPLCLPVGEVGGKPVTGPFIHHLNLSWVRTEAPHEVSDAEMNRSVSALEKWQNLQGRRPREYFFDDSILRVTTMPCTGHRMEGTWCPKAPIQIPSWKVPVASN